MSGADPPRLRCRGDRDPRTWMTSALGELFMRSFGLSDSPSADPQFFRHEYGRLVAMLSRRVGVHRLEAVEDAVQFALLTAVEWWPKAAVPENPSAWLFRVAYNHVASELRRDARHAELAVRYGGHDEIGTPGAPETFLKGEVRDDLLRMLFVCCDDALPVESQ